MKFVLVNKFDEIVNTVKLPKYNRDGRSSDWNDARNYFQGVKRLPDPEDFDKLWRVMTAEEYDMKFKKIISSLKLISFTYFFKFET